MNLYSATMLFASDYPIHHRMVFQGLKIAIENTKGSVRKGVDKHFGPWETKMLCPYGRITGTKGMDGQGVDCFIGPNEQAKNAYVITILKVPDFKKEDEQKVMLGFDSAKAARKAFNQHYDMPDKFFGGMVTLSMSEFKKKVMNTGNGGPKKIQAGDADGNPSAGVSHIDPRNTFHPPSLKNPMRVPTDDPQETDDRFMDVTKRNEYVKQGMREHLLKRSAPGGSMNVLPIRTTQVGLPPA